MLPIKATTPGKNRRQPTLISRPKMPTQQSWARHRKRRPHVPTAIPRRRPVSAKRNSPPPSAPPINVRSSVAFVGNGMSANRHGRSWRRMPGWRKHWSVENSPRWKNYCPRLPYCQRFRLLQCRGVLECPRRLCIFPLVPEEAVVNIIIATQTQTARPLR